MHATQQCWCISSALCVYASMHKLTAMSVSMSCRKVEVPENLNCSYDWGLPSDESISGRACRIHVAVGSLMEYDMCMSVMLEGQADCNLLAGG